MKNARTIGLVMLIVVLATSMSFAARPSKNTMVNSLHDLRSTLKGASFTLCNFCHVAHKTVADTYPSYIGPLLWNHTLSAKTTYGVYTSGTFAAYGTDIADLGTLNGAGYSTSNLCLSCHDGTIAVDSWYAPVTGSSYKPLPGNTFFMPTASTITDLTNTHPVNFTYYNAPWLSAAGVLAPANSSSVDGAGVIPLENGKMQCWTCHDAHNGASAIFEQNFPTQASGSFCTYCHT
jgi:hypothetical protein